MSETIAYRLVVDMSTRGALGTQLDRVGGKAKGLDDSFKKLGDSAAGLGRTLADTFTGVVERAGAAAIGIAKLGTVAGAGAVAYGVAHLNNELEKTQISLASIFGANDITKNMTEGMQRASSVMADMRKDAALLPGEFKDLIGIFRNAAIPGFQAGQSIDQLRAMSAKVMAAAAVTGVPMDQAAREFAMLMEGRAGAHNVLGLRLAGLGGDKAEAFNKSSGAKRVETLNKALDKFAPAIDTYATSFDGLSSTMLDNAKKFLGATTSGLFERTKIAMKDANAWWDRNERSALAFADRIGERLNYAFDFGRAKIAEWTPPVLTFIHTLENGVVGVWERVEPIIERLEPKVKAALTDPHIFDRLEQVAKLYGAIKIGGAGASALGPMMSALGGLGGEGALAAIGGVGPAAVVAATGLVAVGGAIHTLSDETAMFHQTATESWKQTQANVSQATTEVSKALDDMKAPALKIADVIGTATLVHLEALSAELGFVATMANEARPALFGFADALALFSKKETQEPIDPARQAFEPMSVKVMDALADQRILLADGVRAQKTKTGAGGGGGGTHIQKVEIVLTTNQEPSRIARLTVDRLEQINRYAGASKFARNPTSPR